MNDVEEFISRLSQDWQKQICTRLYAVQCESSKHIAGQIKWNDPYFSSNNKYLLKWYVGKSHVNVYFAQGVHLEDPSHLFETTNNIRMRCIKLFDGLIFAILAA